LKFGIKLGYPRAPLPGKLKAYIQLIRPLTLFPAFLAGCFGVVLPLAYAGMSFKFIYYFKEITLAALSLMLVQAYGQVSNQYADIKIDKINKPYRPLVRGVISRKEAGQFSLVLFVLAILLAIQISFIFFCFIIAGLFLAWSYNFDLRIKAVNHWLALFWLALSRGLLPVVATWSVLGSLLSTIPWALGLIAFAWVFAYQGTKDYNDMKGDALNGIPTLFTVYGKERACETMISLGLLPILLSLFLPLAGLLPFENILLASLVIPGLYINIKLCFAVNESKYFENNVCWVVFYAGLGWIYLCALISLLL